MRPYESGLVGEVVKASQASLPSDLRIFLAPCTDVTAGVATLMINGYDNPHVVFNGWLPAVGDVVQVVRQGTLYVALSPGGGEALHYSINGTLTVATGPMRAILPRAATVTAVHAEVGTAPTGHELVVDLLAGATVVATVTVPAGDTAASAATITSPTIAAGAKLAVRVTAVGSTVAGKDLCLSVVWS